MRRAVCGQWTGRVVWFVQKREKMTFGCGVSLLVLVLFPASLTSAECIREGQESELVAAEQNAVENSEIIDEYLQASFNFSLTMFRTLLSVQNGDTVNDNLIFSPHSVWQALVLTYLASDGETSEKMEKAMNLGGLGKVKTAMAYNAIKYFEEVVVPENSEQNGVDDMDFLGASDNGKANKGYQLDSVNKIYFDTHLRDHLNPAMTRFLGEEIKTVDFVNDAENQRLKINQFVAELTRGKIKDLLSPGKISPQTLMALVNAAYFKGQWLHPFDPKETRWANFHLSNGEMVNVPTMHLEDTYFPIGASRELEAGIVELPYASGDGRDISMFIVIPSGTQTIDDILLKLTPENLRTARMHMGRKQLSLLAMPKFKLEDSFELTPIFNSMDLGDLFVAGSANLTCLAPRLGGLALSSADHKAAIEVNEEGTEAAAATAFIQLRWVERFQYGK
ncbi:unnamed protein product [Cyprideis torosa]|uniref:Uncharacterized protein n=1 Tax=Cyprideis torosa TaxID=163714 RepID=A0A7R8ZGS9_9CRUS|nr:unnamed protein product [Cyprideis torosa]CAG0882107.1 unnamed protein product [Cyprideis torosa]